jgi:hypothetical protein
MFSIPLSNLDLALIIGGGFAAVSVIMGIIAYASIQTMKSVKAEVRWKEIATWREKGTLPNRKPSALPPVANRLFLPSSLPASQLHFSGINRMGDYASHSFLGEIENLPKQELLSWDSPNPVMPTLYNDFAATSPLNSSAATSEQPGVAPPPFEDELETRSTATVTKLPSQQFRIVIQNGKKSDKQIRSVRPRTRKSAQRTNRKIEPVREDEGQVKQKQEEIETGKTTTTSLPGPLPPIEKSILAPTLSLATPEDEIETPLITKRNIRNLINKGRHTV